MRIGFFADTYLPTLGGLENSMESFRVNLEKLGHEVFIYAPFFPGYADTHPRVFRLASLRIRQRPEIRFAFPIIRSGPSRRLGDQRLDIVHTHTDYSMRMLARRVAERQHIPTVHTHHSHYQELARVYHGTARAAMKLMHWNAIRLARRTDATIAPSTKVKQMLVQEGITRPVTILPTGVDTDLFAQTNDGESTARDLKQQLGITKETHVLLFVGRIGEEKNIEFLLSLQKRIPESRDDTLLLIVGDGPHLETIKRLALREAVPRVQFTGRIPHQELAPYYHLADLFVFASHTETQGLVILEAMAAGLPAVALHDEAFLDIIASGTNGILVSDGSMETFLQEALALLNDSRRRQQFAESARKTAESFSEKAQAKKLVRLYETVRLNKSHPAPYEQ